MRRELDVSCVLDVDRCRAARHEGLIAHITARYADDPNFELVIAEAEEQNRAYWVDMTWEGHDDEPEHIYLHTYTHTYIRENTHGRFKIIPCKELHNVLPECSGHTLQIVRPTPRGVRLA